MIRIVIISITLFGLSTITTQRAAADHGLGLWQKNYCFRPGGCDTHDQSHNQTMVYRYINGRISRCESTKEIARAFEKRGFEIIGSRSGQKLTVEAAGRLADRLDLEATHAKGVARVILHIPSMIEHLREWDYC